MERSFGGFDRVWSQQLLGVARRAEAKERMARAPQPPGPVGAVDGRYLAFLDTIAQLRPQLHRYCSRMTGSLLDGEDVVQDALLQAYSKLDTFDEARPMTPWLFRIAHNRCIDVLRRRGVRDEVEAVAAGPQIVAPADPVGQAIGRAVEHLVLSLPPKERACVLLKDVFDYSLEEIAPLVQSTVGGVKAALSRGRSKLASMRESSPAPRAANPAAARLLALYVDRFNRRDWDGLRELVAADATLRVADRFAGPIADSPYFGRYARLKTPWRLAAGAIDGEPAIILLGREGDEWTPHAVVRLTISGDRITHITDYCHCPWITRAARSLVMTDS
jgi:RNA polymerase sigma-70 factor, ECF subfamily